MSATWDGRVMRLVSFDGDTSDRATKQANDWLNAHPTARPWQMATTAAVNSGYTHVIITLLVDMPVSEVTP